MICSLNKKLIQENEFLKYMTSRGSTVISILHYLYGGKGFGKFIAKLLK